MYKTLVLIIYWIGVGTGNMGLESLYIKHNDLIIDTLQTPWLPSPKTGQTLIIFNG